MEGASDDAAAAARSHYAAASDGAGAGAYAGDGDGAGPSGAWPGAPDLVPPADAGSFGGRTNAGTYAGAGGGGDVGLDPSSGERIVYNPVTHSYVAPDAVTRRPATAAGRRPRTDASYNDPATQGEDAARERMRVASAPAVTTRSPSLVGQRNPITSEWAVPQRDEEAVRPQGVRSVPLPDHMGKYDPLTHQWTRPPTRPPLSRHGRGRAIVPLAERSGLYNPLTASWVVPPKQPERERGKDHSGIEALNKRVGVYDPLRAEWKQTPAASSDERGRDRSGIEALQKRVGVYDPLRAEWKQTPEGFVERPPPQMHELRGEYADSLKYSQRNRSHDSISWEEASSKPMHRAPAAPDRWDPAAKTIPRGSVGGGAPPPPSMRAAPSGRCSPERRMWVSKTMPKATRVSNSGELPAWRPADDSEKKCW